MNVIIFERDSHRVVVQYPILLVGPNYVPTEREYFDEAWRCAVDIVEPDRRSDYVFEFATPGWIMRVGDRKRKSE